MPDARAAEVERVIAFLEKLNAIPRIQSIAEVAKLNDSARQVLDLIEDQPEELRRDIAGVVAELEMVSLGLLAFKVGKLQKKPVEQVKADLFKAFTKLPGAF